MSRAGAYLEETLKCGCRVFGVAGDRPFSGDFDREPCARHTRLGACVYCRSGQPHPSCETCGLTDGEHASWCNDKAPHPETRR